MMTMERTEAISRAQRALKALGEHPRSSQKELGHAREHLNACYSHSDSDHVWDSVAKVGAMAERRLGVPNAQEQRTDPADRRPRGACDSRPGRHAGDPALLPAAAVGEDRARSPER